jgi:hypothetical protein
MRILTVRTKNVLSRHVMWFTSQRRGAVVHRYKMRGGRGLIAVSVKGSRRRENEPSTQATEPLTFREELEVAVLAAKELGEPLGSRELMAIARILRS